MTLTTECSKQRCNLQVYEKLSGKCFGHYWGILN